MKHLKLDLIYESEQELEDNLKVIKNLIKLGYVENAKINYSFEILDSTKPRIELVNDKPCRVYQSKLNKQIGE